MPSVERGVPEIFIARLRTQPMAHSASKELPTIFMWALAING